MVMANQLKEEEQRHIWKINFGHVELEIFTGYPCGASQQATVNVVWNSEECLE